MLLVENKIYEHVSSDTTIEFEEVIISKSLVTKAKLISPVFFELIYFLYRLAKKIGFSTISKTKSSYLKNPLKDKKHLFTVMMGLDEGKYKPYAFTTNHCRSIFLFDAWPKDYQRIIDFIYKYKINFVFVTAAQSAERLNNSVSRKIFFWIPEGIKIDEYLFKEYADKQIDVLALGRKYDKYHLMIKDDLEAAGIKYLYEKEKGEIIFPTRREFIRGLSDAKISICIPSSITHPHRAGDVETMTIRYLQSMVSKCLVVGHAPKEMIELFGYNPVIEIDIEKPVEQIKTILNDYCHYKEFIEKNYKTVCENHTWLNRWTMIENILVKDKEVL